MRGIQAKQVAGYFILPGLIPRAKELFGSGFGWIAFLMANIYNIVRLIPTGHPYLNATNIGRFGIRHVVAEAANNLIIDKKNIDQIIIFVALFAGIIMLALQLALLAYAYVIQPALASGVGPVPIEFTGSIFTTPNPQKDIALSILDQVFGIPDFFCNPQGVCTDINATLPFPFHIALQSMFQFYSTGLLLIAVLIFLYFVLVIAVETAATGSPFGQRFQNVWVPIRLVVALFLLIPINYGMNSGQYIALFAAKIGSGFATNGWLLYNQSIAANDVFKDGGANPTGERESLLAKPTTPDVAPIVAFMSMVHSCAYAHWHQDTSAGMGLWAPEGYIIHPYLVKADRPYFNNHDEIMVVTETTPYLDAVDFFNKGDIFVRFGIWDPDKYSEETGNVQKTCGEVRIRIGDLKHLGEGDTIGGADMMQNFFFNMIKLMWFGEAQQVFVGNTGSGGSGSSSGGGSGSGDPPPPPGKCDVANSNLYDATLSALQLDQMIGAPAFHTPQQYLNKLLEIQETLENFPEGIGDDLREQIESTLESLNEEIEAMTELMEQYKTDKASDPTVEFPQDAMNDHMDTVQEHLSDLNDTIDDYCADPANNTPEPDGDDDDGEGEDDDDGDEDESEDDGQQCRAAEFPGELAVIANDIHQNIYPHRVNQLLSALRDMDILIASADQTIRDQVGGTLDSMSNTVTDMVEVVQEYQADLGDDPSTEFPQDELDGLLQGLNDQISNMEIECEDDDTTTGSTSGTPGNHHWSNRDLIELAHRFTAIVMNDLEVARDIEIQCTIGCNNPMLPPCDEPNPPCEDTIPQASAKQTVVNEYQVLLETKVLEAWEKYNQKAMDLQIEQDILNLGWGGAGVWFNRLSDMNGAFANSVFDLPAISSMPLVMEEVRDRNTEADSDVSGIDLFEPFLSGKKPMTGLTGGNNGVAIATALNKYYKYWVEEGQNYARQDKSISQNTFENIMNILFGTNGLFEIRRANAHVHPLSQLTAVGKGLVDSAVRNVAGGAIFAFMGGPMGAMSGLFGTMAQSAAGLLNSTAFVGITAGFVLFYVLPFLPFVYFFFAVGSWCKGIFEAMVGVPLWALAHLRIDGEGLPGESASNGYFLIFDIFIRPILTVFGLIAALLIFTAQVRLLNFLWLLVVDNVSGVNTTEGVIILAEVPVVGEDGEAAEPLKMQIDRSIIDQFFFTVIYTIICYMLATASFKLIDNIPKNILRWMGAGVSAFGDLNQDPVEGLNKYAALGGMTLGQKVTGAVQSAATGLGNVAGGELAKLKNAGIPKGTGGPKA